MKNKSLFVSNQNLIVIINGLKYKDYVCHAHILH